MNYLKECSICPRKCKVDRYKFAGFCGEKNKIKIAKVMVANFEEPCISHKNGSGAIFFSGCNLKCVFCQNNKISSDNFGKSITIKKLAQIMLDLQNKNADNINLITPTHFIPQIAKALKLAQLKIPVVFNSGGYESTAALKLLDGLVDIYLPDFKYSNNSLALKYSKAPNYVETALNAIKEMVRQTSGLKFSHSKKLLKGVIVRHLVLPNNIENSLNALEILNNNFNENQILVSLMSQFTPLNNLKNFKELNCTLTEKEYNIVLNRLNSLPFDGFTQHLSSSGTECIPEFDLSGF